MVTWERNQLGGMVAPCQRVDIDLLPNLVSKGKLLWGQFGAAGEKHCGQNDLLHEGLLLGTEFEFRELRSLGFAEFGFDRSYPFIEGIAYEVGFGAGVLIIGASHILEKFELPFDLSHSAVDVGQKSASFIL